MENQLAKKARREYMKKWRKDNKEKVNSYQKEWRKNNKDKVVGYQEKFWQKKAKEIYEQQ